VKLDAMMLTKALQKRHAMQTWSPDSTKMAFTLRSSGGPHDSPRGALQLWVAEIADGFRARQLLQRPLNTVFEDYTWIDDDTIVAAVLPPDHGPRPERPIVPFGPKIEDNSSGKKAQARTYPDLLQSAHDEELFDYYGSSELVTIKVSTQETKVIGPKRVYTGTAPSPDGRFMLVSWFDRPYSYAVPCGRFPKKVELWDTEGTLVRQIADLPLAEDIPIAFNSCRKGPRGIGWRDDKPSEISWMEAQDGGDPAVAVSPRDIVYALDASASSSVQPRQIAATDLRCNGVAWGSGELALLYENEWKTRRSITSIIAPDNPTIEKKVLFDRNYEDSYSGRLDFIGCIFWQKRAAAYALTFSRGRPVKV
jgi:dipeptidyl aminopeptidase/acylaminoacyl peptidase